MKDFFFSFIAFVSAGIIAANTAIGTFFVGGLASLFNGFNWIVKAISVRLMLAIDSNRYKHISGVIEQRGELTELGILRSITQVKESAIQQKAWTMRHTAAMNQLGNALHSQCGWEPARIHGYMRTVIEGIPGLTYYGGDFESDAETV